MLSKGGCEAFIRKAVCCGWAVIIMRRESNLKEKQIKEK